MPTKVKWCDNIHTHVWPEFKSRSAAFELCGVIWFGFLLYTPALHTGTLL